MFNAEYLKECFDYDPATGLLIWKIRPLHHFVSAHAMNITNSRQAGKVAGSDNGDGYITIRIGKMQRAHQIAWAIYTGLWPTSPIDHRNGIRSDNRIENLRMVTVGQNNLNSATRRDNVLQARGIYRTKYGTFRASITMKGRRRALGSYATQEEAQGVRELAAEMLYGDFYRKAA